MSLSSQTHSTRIFGSSSRFASEVRKEAGILTFDLSNTIFFILKWMILLLLRLLPLLLLTNGNMVPKNDCKYHSCGNLISGVACKCHSCAILTFWVCGSSFTQMFFQTCYSVVFLDSSSWSLMFALFFILIFTHCSSPVVVQSHLQQEETQQLVFVQ